MKPFRKSLLGMMAAGMLLTACGAGVESHASAQNAPASVATAPKESPGKVAGEVALGVIGGVGLAAAGALMLLGAIASGMN
jgi:hypothetical protein